MFQCTIKLTHDLVFQSHELQMFQIFEELKSHVAKYDPLYLEPLYDLLTGLAQDVQYEFVKVRIRYLFQITVISKRYSELRFDQHY